MRIRYRALIGVTFCAFGLAAPALAATTVMAYDTNGDSVLTRAEFQGLQIDSFKVRDTNGDGAVTQTEYLAVAPGFQKADVNNDGVLAGKEITRVAKFLAQAGY